MSLLFKQINRRDRHEVLHQHLLLKSPGRRAKQAIMTTTTPQQTQASEISVWAYIKILNSFIPGGMNLCNRSHQVIQCMYLDIPTRRKLQQITTRYFKIISFLVQMHAKCNFWIFNIFSKRWLSFKNQLKIEFLPGTSRWK